MDEVDVEQRAEEVRGPAFGALCTSDPARAAERIAALIAAGQTGGQIAEHFDVDKTTLRRWMRRLRGAGQRLPELRPGRRPKVPVEAGPQATPREQHVVAQVRRFGRSGAAKRLQISRQAVGSMVANAQAEKAPRGRPKKSR